MVPPVRMAEPEGGPSSILPFNGWKNPGPEKEERCLRLNWDMNPSLDPQSWALFIINQSDVGDATAAK